MSPLPDKFDDHTLVITKEMLGSGQEAFTMLAEQGLEVHAGLTPEYADAIIKMALEPSIREYCPNDSGQRFMSRQSIEQWLSKRRGTFLLMKRSEDDALSLIGYGWVGDSTSNHVPGGETTFAIRIGEAGQGKGLAAPFSQVIIEVSKATYGAKNIWLETWASNGGAVHIYHKIGFVDVDQVPEERPTIGGGKVHDTRLYMSLPDSN